MTDQEAENVAASVRHLLTQRGKDAREWERQAKQWEAQAAQHRTTIEGLQEANKRLQGDALADLRPQIMQIIIDGVPPDFAEHIEYWPEQVRPVITQMIAELDGGIGAQIEGLKMEKQGYLAQIEALTLALDAQTQELSELRASATLAVERCKGLEAQKRALLARIAQLEEAQA